MGAPAPAWVAEYHHWLPVGALLVRIYPELVTTAGAGTALTVTLRSGDSGPLPQELVPLTVITPEDAPTAKSTVMELVLPPLTMAAPVGTVQL